MEPQINFSREDQLRKHIDKSKLGLEIGPYVNPIVPKSQGYNVRILDVFNEEELISKAKDDPNIPSEIIQRIEKVDFVCTADEISEHVKDNKFDYILSSHNLEHIPNPLKFLNGCAALLNENGYISLALPDFRCCWDRFRPHTTTADWLEAYFEKRDKPSAKQFFLQNSLHCRWDNNGELKITMPLDTDLNELLPLETLKEAYNRYEEFISNKSDMPYIDTHCWAFTPNTFSLIMHDLLFLKLLPLNIESISETMGNEFIVHLKKTNTEKLNSQEFYTKRRNLLYKSSAHYLDQIN